MSKKKEAVMFDSEVNGKTTKLLVQLPNLDQQREGQKEYNKAFSAAVQSGALLRAKLEDFMEEQGIWNQEKQVKMTSLSKEVSEKEKTLAEGGIKLSDAKKVALELRRLREDIRQLISQRIEMDVHTAEGQADNARFNYWVSACLVYNNTKKPVFSGVDDYLNKSNEEYATLAASKLAEMLYSVNSDFENNLEENAFLREFGFVDEKNRLVNKEGKLVNEEGKLVDEEGYFVDEDGQRVDPEGNPLDEKGRYKFDRKPFLDDDGEPIENLKEDTVETVESE